MIATNNAAVKAVVNGGIDNTNIDASAGVALSKLASTGSIGVLAIGSTGVSTTVALVGGRGNDITAANTISVTANSHRVNGTTTIKTIQLNSGTPTDGMFLVLHAATTIINFDSTGNIFATGASGTRAVPVNAAIMLAYEANSAVWRVCGVGS